MNRRVVPASEPSSGERGNVVLRATGEIDPLPASPKCVDITKVNIRLWDAFGGGAAKRR